MHNDVFATLRAEDHDYFEAGFRSAGALDGVRHSGTSALTAHRLGTTLIREAIGADACLLGCGAPIRPSIGLFDAMRISPGTAPHRRPEAGDHRQPGQDPAEFTGVGRQWQHDRRWINDPDRLTARPAPPCGPAPARQPMWRPSAAWSPPATVCSPPTTGAWRRPAAF